MVDELIAEINNRGLRINNLAQLEDGRWQANITDGERFWEFGRGDTAEKALIAAIQKHATTEPSLGLKSRVTPAPRAYVPGSGEDFHF